MKKYFALLSSALVLTACGGAETSSSTPSSSSQPTATAAAKTEMTPIQRGKRLYKRCQACHTLEQDGRNKVGPNLWAIYGAQAGSKEGFAYSKAMKASEVVWTDETMDAYLRKPAEYMPGTKMSFIGLKKQEDRDAVQAYLKSKTTPDAAESE